MLFILLGAFLLYVGAEALVRASVSLATRTGVSALVAGLTVVAFGTSAPELSVSISSALEGKSGIALGNVVGSNIFNIAVILGIAALINPLQIHLNVIRRDIPIMIVSSGILLALIATGTVSALAGVGLLAALAAYLFFTVRLAKKESRPADEIPSLLTKHWLLDGGVLIVGLSILIFGSRLFVDGATSLAKSLGVSDAIIGLTIVAAGTSLPELATSVVAALKKQSDIAVGNVVGSNIFNVFCIIGATSVVTPIDAAGIELRDSLTMLGLSLVLLPFAFTGRRISRMEGLVFCGVYAGYVFFLWPR
ncbi:calcium/sodium antiporter [Roseibacillus persicicus]|uniref:calcium/sodium antiporter n=1 Tax=Roseibacillus persicicus TaxID=454148 RepID=UPI00280D363E|nr:calcium/sodium antiporter [Roseibacillus persicicus]MDQ8190532.1 calcium/sodium antiporter [Roseibacillus persicicus]